MSEERHRTNDVEIALLKQTVETMEQHLRDRESANNERIKKLETSIEDLNREKAKWTGGILLLTALGSIFLWVASMGGNLMKVFGK
jgi:predicted  nucleic acid-binding Zn-ribbon protein